MNEWQFGTAKGKRPTRSHSGEQCSHLFLCGWISSISFWFWYFWMRIIVKKVYSSNVHFCALNRTQQNYHYELEPELFAHFFVLRFLPQETLPHTHALLAISTGGSALYQHLAPEDCWPGLVYILLDCFDAVCECVCCLFVSCSCYCLHWHVLAIAPRIQQTRIVHTRSPDRLGGSLVPSTRPIKGQPTFGRNFVCLHLRGHRKGLEHFHQQ